MNVLITGGSGFIGSNLARYLLSKGHNVTVVDNLQRQGSEINLRLMKDEFPGLCFYKKELDDIPELISKFNLDIIYHFAAQVAVTSSYDSPKSDFRINALGTFNLTQSTNVPIIYASTNKVYGDNVNELPVEELETRYDFANEFKQKGIPETFPIDAKKHTPYGCSKLTGDIYIRESGGIVNRFSCIYGVNQFGNTDQGWVSHFIISKIKNKPLTIFGNGKQVRDLLYIADLLKLLEMQGEKIKQLKGSVFNIGGGFNNTLSLLELCNLLDIKPQFEDWRQADQKVYYSDITKVKEKLNWQPEVSVEEGIKKITEWVRNNENLFGI